MPVYEYVCKKCGECFERVETVSEHDPAKVRCPECKSKQVERRWSPVFAVTSKKS
jgi:putative FmdB family regulatory protein